MTDTTEEEILLEEFDKILKEHFENPINLNYSHVDFKKWLQPMTI